MTDHRMLVGTSTARSVQTRAWLSNELRLAGAQIRVRRATRRTIANDPVLIYQMGKVGSRTVFETLNSVETFQHRLLHLHYLERGRLGEVIAAFRSARRRTPVTSASSVRLTPRFAWRGMEVARAIARDKSRSWTVITLVREPVSRDISAFFQNLTGVVGYDLTTRMRRASVETILEEIRPLFNAYFIDSPGNAVVNAGLTWFDDELRTVFDLDVFATDFPWELGYQIMNAKRVRLLILRLEDLDRIGSQALGEFLGVDVPRLVQANTADGKQYRSIVRAFAETVLPDPYLERVYGSKLCRHFYSPAEIESFRGRWVPQ